MEENLKDFTVNWAIFGLLFFCLMAFAINFMYDNNPIGLDDGSGDIFESIEESLNNNLYEIEPSSDKILNITSTTNPEASYLGSRDSVGISYEGYGTGRSFWQSAKPMITWIFSGAIGVMLITVLGGLIGFLGTYFIVKLIRQGN